MSLEDLARAHADITSGVQSLYAERARIIRETKDDGATWPQIAAVLGMTVHGAIKASKMGAHDRLTTIRVVNQASG